MPSDYDELLTVPEQRTLFHGVSVGIVTNVQDPDGLARVKLRLPWLSAKETNETGWARVAMPSAGPDRGFYFLPEVDDEVLVSFEHGDPQRPIVVGALWNGQDKPPEGNHDGKNDVKMIRSRSGHVVKLVDTDGAELISIVDKSGKNTIVIDTAKNTVSLTADADVSIEAKSGALTLKGQTVEITAQSELKLKGGTAELTSDGTLKIKGQVVNIN